MKIGLLLVPTKFKLKDTKYNHLNCIVINQIKLFLLMIKIIDQDINCLICKKIVGLFPQYLICRLKIK